MTTYIDTSAFYALLDADDKNNLRAKDAWLNLLQSEERLVSNNYVLLETISLIQRRLGMEAVRDFQQDTVPMIFVDWLGEDRHQAAISALLTSFRRQLSLTDCSSFETMRKLGIRRVFAYDPHFSEQGFNIIS